MRILLVLLTLLVPTIASADVGALSKISDDELEIWRANPAKETPATTGERFLKALEERDPRVAAGVIDAATVRFHDKEAKRFAKDKSAVLTAYGVLYGLLVAFVVAMGFRQKKLIARIDALTAKLAQTEPK